MNKQKLKPTFVKLINLWICKPKTVIIDQKVDKNYNI